jgi:hypothetical protein
VSAASGTFRVDVEEQELSLTRRTLGLVRSLALGGESAHGHVDVVASRVKHREIVARVSVASVDEAEVVANAMRGDIERMSEKEFLREWGTHGVR